MPVKNFETIKPTENLFFFLSQRTRKNRTTNYVLLMPKGHGIKFGLGDCGLQSIVLKQPNFKFICHLKNTFRSFSFRCPVSCVRKGGCYPHLSQYICRNNSCRLSEFRGVHRNVPGRHRSQVCLPLLYLPPSEKT